MYSLCVMNLYNIWASLFKLNFWNKLTFAWYTLFYCCCVAWFSIWNKSSTFYLFKISLQMWVDVLAGLQYQPLLSECYIEKCLTATLLTFCVNTLLSVCVAVSLLASQSSAVLHSQTNLSCQRVSCTSQSPSTQQQAAAPTPPCRYHNIKAIVLLHFLGPPCSRQRCTNNKDDSEPENRTTHTHTLLYANLLVYSLYRLLSEWKGHQNIGVPWSQLAWRSWAADVATEKKILHKSYCNWCHSKVCEFTCKLESQTCVCAKLCLN